MEIGIITNFNVDTDLRARFLFLRSLGFSCCQLSVWNPTVLHDLSCAEQVKKIAEETGMRISHFWSGYGGRIVWDLREGPSTIGLVPPQTREQRVSDLIAGSDFGRVLGAPYLVTHAGFLPEDPADPKYAPTVEALRKVAAHCQENGQTFLFETGQETPTTLARTIEDVGLRNLGVNLDPANLILYGKANPVDALDILGKYVHGVHGKDGCYPTNGRELGAEKRIGEGKVDFESLLTRLVKEFHYQDGISIEREIQEGSPEQTADLLYAKGYFERILSKLN